MSSLFSREGLRLLVDLRPITIDPDLGGVADSTVSSFAGLIVAIEWIHASVQLVQYQRLEKTPEHAGNGKKYADHNAHDISFKPARTKA
ncbi:hypothetical protein [Pseudomonas sp. RIT-To-2]|uniref:hypothetical protein n=1 Tax=Pseudomonas sp. RIT-To-2 TaxID=3462541 RepID=UPI0024135261